MAKRKRTERTESAARRNFIRLCAFLALLVSAVLLVVGSVLGKLFSALVMHILQMTASLSLLVAIALPAWEFVRGKKKGWKLVYWIALAVYVAGAVLGVVLSL